MIDYVQTEQQKTDLFTKSLDALRFDYLKKSLGVCLVEWLFFFSLSPLWSWVKICFWVRWGEWVVYMFTLLYPYMCWTSWLTGWLFVHYLATWVCLEKSFYELAYLNLLWDILLLLMRLTYGLYILFHLCWSHVTFWLPPPIIGFVERSLKVDKNLFLKLDKLPWAWNSLTWGKGYLWLWGKVTKHNTCSLRCMSMW